MLLFARWAALALFSLPLAGVRADTALPPLPTDPAAVAFAALAVRELPRHATLRTSLGLSSHHGCSMSYSSVQEQVETPRAFRDENHAISSRWTGRARVTGSTLEIELDRPAALNDSQPTPRWTLSCRLREVPRGDVPNMRAVSALVCDPPRARRC